MKEFHIVTVGISIIINARNMGIAGIDMGGDDSFFEDKIDDPAFLEELISWVEEEPKRASAELNSFLRKVEGIDPEDVAVYLVSTRTSRGEICRVVLENVLKSLGYEIFVGEEVSGYFWEAERYDERFAREEFKRDISSLLDRLIYVALRKKEEGYRVFFNPTGGLKAHVIACAIAGFLTGCEIYYMHEEFKDVITLPILFYLPKGRELELLRELSRKVVVSKSAFHDIVKRYKKEIERLKIYGLLEVNQEDHLVKLTSRGSFIAKELGWES